MSAPNVQFSIIFISVSCQTHNSFLLINGAAYSSYFRIQRLSKLGTLAQITETSQIRHLCRTGSCSLWLKSCVL